MSSTRAERKATRRVDRLACRSASPARAICARCSAVRPKARSTGSPSKTSAIWRPSASTWRQRSPASARLARPTSAPNTREEGDGDEDDDARDPVEHADRGRQGDRRHDGEHEVGQAPADVDVEGVETPSGQRRQVAGTAGPAGRGAAERRGDQPRPQVGLGRRGTAAGERLSAERGEAAHRRRGPPSQTNAGSRSPGWAPGIAPASRRASATAWTTTVAVDTRPTATEAATVRRTTGSSPTSRRSTGPSGTARPPGRTPKRPGHR